MKKILLSTLLVSIIALAGCNSNADVSSRLDSLEQRVSVLENGKVPASKKPTGSESNTSTQTSNESFNADVLSFELASTDSNAKSHVKHTYQVTNKGNEPIEYISIKVAYYDDSGNCIDTDGRFKDVVVESGKFVAIDSYGGDESTKDNIATSKVVSYDYYLVEPNSNGNNKIEVNCETGKIKESSVNR